MHEGETNQASAVDVWDLLRSLNDEGLINCTSSNYHRPCAGCDEVQHIRELLKTAPTREQEGTPPMSKKRVLAILELEGGLLLSKVSPEVTDTEERVKAYAATLRDMAKSMVEGWKRGKARQKAEAKAAVKA